jgi:NhaP-type Na+/H+ or K+/H+ antiporter
LNTRGISHWDSALRVRIGQTGVSSSDFLFGAAIYCGICAIVYFVFGIIVRRPIAVLCGYAHLWMSANLLFSAASYIRGIVPSTPLTQLPGHFVSGFFSAQLFFLVYCVAGIFSAPPQNEYVRLTGENP